MMPTQRAMYQALVARDSSYEGVFVVGVKTTGIFCRPSCPAKKPKPENVEFFSAAKGALLSGYRPCLRCRPLEAAGSAPEWLAGLLAEIEEDPDAAGATAIAGPQPRPDLGQALVPGQPRDDLPRLPAGAPAGVALGRIRAGEELTGTAYAAGYESESASGPPSPACSAPRRAARATPSRRWSPACSHRSASMVAAARDDALLLLEFADRRMLEKQIDRIRRQVPARFVPGENDVLARTQAELDEYFAGARREFTVPLDTPGSEFQRAVWDALRAIPYGETRSYLEQARAIGRADAVRAVARANGDNRIAILCHRVIGSSGELTGYGGWPGARRRCSTASGRRDPRPGGGTVLRAAGPAGHRRPGRLAGGSPRCHRRCRRHAARAGGRQRGRPPGLKRSPPATSRRFAA